MKKFVIAVLIAVGFVAGSAGISLANDWDKAGKVLAITEGLRVVTGGRVDVVGSITGVNSPREQQREHGRFQRARHPGYYVYEQSKRPLVCERIWVPHYVWSEQYVPEHSEVRDGFQIWIGAHYEKVQVEQGGHWEEISRSCGNRR